MSMTASAPQKDEEAQLKYAEITRDQWDDYQTRFVPRENALIDAIGNKEMQGLEMARAGDAVDQAYDTTEKNNTMRAARTGGMSDEQRKAASRRMELGKAKTGSKTTNNVRQNIKDRDLNLLSGMVNTGRGVRGQALGGLASSAQAEASRNNTNTQIAANNTAGRWGVAGSAAGLAIMA